MLELEELGKLLLERPLRPGMPAHVATASGLVRHGERLFVVADDEPLIAVFDRPGSPGRPLILADSELPLAYDERKALKPDLESLASLPSGGAWPAGALITLGSGATAARERGWLMQLDGDGAPQAPVQFSLSPLYAHLRDELPDLNIEGVAACDGAIWLAQRGNGANGFDALVELALPDVEAMLARDCVLEAAAVVDFSIWELGAIGDIRLTFSDLAPSARGELLLFCAVAEATTSTYDDGPCVGAGVGVLNPRSRVVERFERLPAPHKIEGIASLGIVGARENVLLVTDEDAPESPAALLRTAA